MHAHVFVRVLSLEEEQTLQAGLRSSDGFLRRRCQILLASARGKKATEIAAMLGSSHEIVRQVIHRFNQEGLAVLQAKSRKPHHTHEAFDAIGLALLMALLHRSPRDFGKPTSRWASMAHAPPRNMSS